MATRIVTLSIERSGGVDTLIGTRCNEAEAPASVVLPGGPADAGYLPEGVTEIAEDRHWYATVLWNYLKIIYDYTAFSDPLDSPLRPETVTTILYDKLRFPDEMIPGILSALTTNASALMALDLSAWSIWTQELTCAAERVLTAGNWSAAAYAAEIPTTAVAAVAGAIFTREYRRGYYAMRGGSGLCYTGNYLQLVTGCGA